MVGAKQLKVRLRPELRQAESLHVARDVGKAVDKGALRGDVAATMELLMLTAQPPQALLRAMYATLTDKYYGCLLYTSDAADERSSVDLGGRRLIKKKKSQKKKNKSTIDTHSSQHKHPA